MLGPAVRRFFAVLSRMPSSPRKPFHTPATKIECKLIHFCSASRITTMRQGTNDLHKLFSARIEIFHSLPRIRLRQMHVNPTIETTLSFDARSSRHHRVSPARHLLQLTPLLLRTVCVVPRSHTRRVSHFASASSSTTRVLMLSKSHRVLPFDCLSYPVCFVRMRQARGRGSSFTERNDVTSLPFDVALASVLRHRGKRRFVLLRANETQRR